MLKVPVYAHNNILGVFSSKNTVTQIYRVEVAEPLMISDTDHEMGWTFIPLPDVKDHRQITKRTRKYLKKISLDPETNLTVFSKTA